MRQFRGIVLAALLLPVLAAGQPSFEGTVIVVFGSEIRLPGECRFAGRAAVDTEARFYCLLPTFESYSIILRNARSCSEESLRGAAPDVNVRYDSRRDGRRQMEGVTSEMVIRQIYDSEVCLTAMAASERRLDEILQVLWF